MAVLSTLTPPRPIKERFQRDLDKVQDFNLTIKEFNDVLAKRDHGELASELCDSLTDAGHALLSVHPSELTYEFFDKFERIEPKKLPVDHVPGVYLVMVPESDGSFAIKVGSTSSFENSQWWYINNYIRGVKQDCLFTNKARDAVHKPEMIRLATMTGKEMLGTRELLETLFVMEANTMPNAEPKWLKYVRVIAKMHKDNDEVQFFGCNRQLPCHQAITKVGNANDAEIAKTTQEQEEAKQLALTCQRCGEVSANPFRHDRHVNGTGVAGLSPCKHNLRSEFYASGEYQKDPHSCQQRGVIAGLHNIFLPIMSVKSNKHMRHTRCTTYIGCTWEGRNFHGHKHCICPHCWLVFPWTAKGSGIPSPLLTFNRHVAMCEAAHPEGPDPEPLIPVSATLDNIGFTLPASVCRNVEVGFVPNTELSLYAKLDDYPLYKDALELLQEYEPDAAAAGDDTDDSDDDAEVDAETAQFGRDAAVDAEGMQVGGDVAVLVGGDFGSDAEVDTDAEALAADMPALTNITRTHAFQQNEDEGDDDDQPPTKKRKARGSAIPASSTTTSADDTSPAVKKAKDDDNKSILKKSPPKESTAAKNESTPVRNEVASSSKKNTKGSGKSSSIATKDTGVHTKIDRFVAGASKPTPTPTEKKGKDKNKNNTAAKDVGVQMVMDNFVGGVSKSTPMEKKGKAKANGKGKAEGEGDNNAAARGTAVQMTMDMFMGGRK